MTETKWTPGPWSAAARLGDSPKDVAEIFGVHGCHVASTMDGPSETDDETVANAHLIAAAPELYDALADAIGLLRLSGADKAFGNGGAEVAALERVLAKARGAA